MDVTALVSIVIAAHKFRCFGRALDSVLGQTYPALELVICDDNPTARSPRQWSAGAANRRV